MKEKTLQIQTILRTFKNYMYRGEEMKRNIFNAVVGVVIGFAVVTFANNHKSPAPIIVETKATTYAEESVTAVVEEVTVDTVAEPTTEEQTTEELTSLGIYKLTAYCSCNRCSGQWGTRTSTGTTATQGRTVAVDPKEIPYGTVLVINGLEYVAEDCGGSVDGKHIDIFFNSHKEALEFGVQYVEIYERR